MDTVTFGRTGLNVTVAGLGTGGRSRVGQGQGLSFEHSVNVVKAALDLGINNIDTSSFYDTEEIVGAAIKGRRDQVVISTKNLMVRSRKDLHGTDYLTAAEFKAAVEGNLKRLGTDYIDILHVHGVCDHQYPYCKAELVPVLYQLRDEGKIRFLAISERFYLEMEHQMLTKALPDDYWDVIMVGHNFVNQTANEKVFPLTIKNNVATQCIYAVRNHLANPEKAKKLIEDTIATGQVDLTDVDRDDPLGFFLAESTDGSLTNVCYRYNRYTPGVHVVLTGTGSIDHLKQNIRSINDKPLSKETVDRLNRIFGKVTKISGD